MPTLNWLHLTDWHQGREDFDRKMVLRALLKDVEERANIDPALAKIDFLFFTGDLAFSGQESEYKSAAKDFLTPLQEKLGIERERVITIPGNHDIDRNLVEYLGEGLKNPFKSLDEQKKILSDKRYRQQLSGPFEQYEKFIKRHKHTGFGSFGGHKVFEIEGTKIGVFGCNSALMCARVFKDITVNGVTKKEVDDQHHLAVCEIQMVPLIDEVAGSDLVIGLVHHPYDWLTPFDEVAIEHLFEENAHVVLMGHEHHQVVGAKPGEVKRSVIVNGGATFDGRTPNHPIYTNTYSFVSYDLETKQFRTFIRVLGKHGDEFQADSKPTHIFTLDPKLGETPLVAVPIQTNTASSAEIPELPTPTTEIPSNLPRLQPFFGREAELKQVHDALDPADRTWGVAIDGPGGMGKTSLAVKAAYECTKDQFDQIVFVTVKDRELDDDGERKLEGYLIPDLITMVAKMAEELGITDIAKHPEAHRFDILYQAMKGRHVLLVLDNLESLTKDERQRLFNFVRRLPSGCKAIMTSRVRIGTGADTLILQELDLEAALETLAELASHNRVLARTSDEDRIRLFKQTAGKPLLLRWTAGQLGRGSCVTVDDAIAYLKSCPPKNNPLEFIFGDLAQEFTPEETQVLVALTYFSQPTKVEHIANVSDVKSDVAEPALKSLANRSLVVPDMEYREYTLVPLVAEFLRKYRVEMVKEIGDRLEKAAYALIIENGYQNHDRFWILDKAWPIVAPALPLLLAGPTDRLQTVAAALDEFLDFTGRWDEGGWFANEAEPKAVAAGNFEAAGWRALRIGWIAYLRSDAELTLAAAERAQSHWKSANAGLREQAAAIRLRGLGLITKGDLDGASVNLNQALEIYRSISPRSSDVALSLNSLANVERRKMNVQAARTGYEEALEIARELSNPKGEVIYLGNLAAVAADEEDWPTCEDFARRALEIAETKVFRQELIGSNSTYIAQSLAMQGKPVDGFHYAERAVEIYFRLGHPDLAWAQRVLALCQANPPRPLPKPKKKTP